MNEDNKILERAINTSAACLLPSLLSNFDANPLSHDEFNEFREILFDQLHLLLDILYQNRNLLNDKTFDNQHVQL
ncbi:CLUMA_CG018119, isoform A, partial [Clunio marinus]